MAIKLEPVTRNNWEKAMALSVKKEQQRFTPTVAVSLAKVSIKPDGDHVTYLPFAILDEEEMAGFIMHAYEEGTANMYWINGLLIDEKHQGKGYGKAALTEMITWIVNRFEKCEEVRLTVFPENRTARKLYKQAGFRPTGGKIGAEEVWAYSVEEMKS